MDGTDADYDWYFENVVVGGRPAQPGPAMRHQLAWQDVADRFRGTSPVADLALTQGFVVTTEQVRGLGISMAELRRRTRRGEWTTPHRGVICVVPVGTGRGAHGMAPEIRASAIALLTGTAISFESAASAFGLPLVGQPPARPRVTTAPRSGCGRPTGLIRPSHLDREDLTSWFGAPMTAVARVAVDLARHDLRAGLVAADAALHEELCTADALAGAVARARQWPGVRSARRMVELACGDVESPLESLARLHVVDAGLPLPRPQRWITTPWGNYRVDGLWSDRDVVLEVDGMLKYLELDRQERASALVQEKVRQERLERCGYRVVRVTWTDVTDDVDETTRRIIWALRRGGTRRSNYPPYA